MSATTKKIGKAINEAMQDGGAVNEAIKTTGKLNSDELAVIKEKPRLSLKDFYYADKHAEGSRMAIILPSGEDSSEWLTVRGPDCDESIQAQRAYSRALFALDESMLEMKVQSEASGNFFEYNVQQRDAIKELNIQLACEIVTDWSFDDKPYSKEALTELLHQCPMLTDQISDYHHASREKINQK